MRSAGSTYPALILSKSTQPWRSIEYPAVVACVDGSVNRGTTLADCNWISPDSALAQRHIGRPDAVIIDRVAGDLTGVEGARVSSHRQLLYHS